MSTAAADRGDLKRLHLINALFAQVTGSDLYLAHQIKAAIAFSLSELEAQAAADPASAERYDLAFAEAAARLLAKSCAHQPSHGFYHWDATRTVASSTPLFARSEVMSGLKRLAKYRHATFLITDR